MPTFTAPRLHLLPDLIILVVDLSKCKGSGAEIAQLQLELSDLFLKTVRVDSLAKERT
jgi:hypothetical protein